MTRFTRCVGCLLIVLSLTGCPSSRPAPSGSGKTGSSGGLSAERCADHLKNAFNSLDPERLELDADIESTVSVLNDWLVNCGSLEEVSAEDEKLLAGFLNDEERPFHQARQFVSRDIAQIRTNILLRQMAEKATAGAGSDLERVVRLFEYVTRNVVLQPDNQSLPITLYEVVLFGRATSRHQAWAYAELLHQLKFDSVILTPAGENDQDEWVLAVLLEEGNYLFDFSLLTPVPADVDDRTWPIAHPATLKQAIENPALLDGLRQAGSRVPTSQALKSPQVWIPSDSSYWSARMHALNSTLAGKPFLVADSLLDPDGGILTRIDKASDFWKRSDIKPWSFPTEQLRGYWSIGPNTSEDQVLRNRKMPFYAPMEIIVNQETKKFSIQHRTNKQWKSRLAQLRGSYRQAISSYGTLRLGSRGTKSIFQEQADATELQDALRREDAAAEDAHFWVGTSQMELGQYSEAAVTLSDYLNKYPNSSWTDAVYMLLGIIEMKKDDPEDAAAQFSQVPDNSLMRPAADFILSRIAPAVNNESP